MRRIRVISKVFLVERYQVEVDRTCQEHHVGQELSHEDAVLVLLPESLQKTIDEACLEDSCIFGVLQDLHQVEEVHLCAQ